MRRVLAATAGAFLLSTTGAVAQTLVMALSTERVAITSNFTGAGVTVFGAIEAEGDLGAVDEFDLVVVLRGPSETITIRRKERVLGLWINRAEATFTGVPAFYALHASRPLSEVAPAPTLAALGLGLNAVAAAAGSRDFAEALIRLRGDAGTYYERSGTIDRPSRTVFRTSFELPADIAVGVYTAEVLLFRSGSLLASLRQPLEVIKTGAEQFIFDASRSDPWLYAIAVVAFAVGAGWLGGVIFRKD